MNCFRYSVNTHGRDKDWDFEKLATGFQDRQGTLHDVINHVSQGHALCVGSLGGQRREKANVIGSEWALIDIDNSAVLRDENGKPIKDEHGKTSKIYHPQLTLEEALAHPFVQAHCSLIYTTASHTPEWHKFRLVFLLPHYIEKTEQIEGVVRLLMQELPYDPACKDASRVFYGSTKATFPLVNPDVRLPESWIEQAIAAAEKETTDRAALQAERLAKRAQFQATATAESWDTDALIRQAISYIPPRTPGSGTYDESLKVAMAIHSHFPATEAERILEQWSPSSPGSSWNIRKKVSSFKRSGIGIGTLFHIAKGYGFNFPSAQLGEWVDSQGGNSDPDERFLSKVRSFANKGMARFTQAVKAIDTPKPEATPELYTAGSIPQKVTFKADDRAAVIKEAIDKGYRHILDTSQTGTGKSYGTASLTPIDLGIDPEDESAKIWWIDANHRNPTTLPAERNFEDLPVRHNGLKIDTDRVTPGDSYHTRHPKPGEIPDIQGNCLYAGLFHGAKQKGYDAASETAKENKICKACPFNHKCGKASGPGFGFRYERQQTFKQRQIRAALESMPPPGTHSYNSGVLAVEEAGAVLKPVKTIAANFNDYLLQSDDLRVKLPEQYELLLPLLDNLRSPIKGEGNPYHGYDHEAVKALVGQLPPGLDLNAIRSEFSEVLGEVLGTEEPDQVDTSAETKALQSLRGKVKRKQARLEKLTDSLDDDIETVLLDKIAATQRQWKKFPTSSKLEDRWNRLQCELAAYQDSKEAKEASGFNLAVTVDNAEIEAEIENLRAEIADLEAQIKLLENERNLIGSFNRREKRAGRKELAQAIEELPNQWLVPLLNILAGERPGALRIRSHGGLTITMPDHRQSEILAAAKTVIYLDATATREMLSLHAGIPASEILEIKQIVEQAAALDMIQVKGFNSASKQRSESTDGRLNTFLDWVKNKHGGAGNVAVLDHLKKVEVTHADGHHFGSDARGSNRFEAKQALVIVGLPKLNLAVIQDRWLALGGSATGIPFDHYYQQETDAALIQEIGRLRANRRPGENLTVYVCYDCDRSNHHYQIPLPHRVVEVVDLCPGAASVGDRALSAMAQAGKRLKEEGKRITQAAIAAIVGCTQQNVQKVWQELQNLLKSLLDMSFTNTTNPILVTNKNGCISETAPEVVEQTAQMLNVAAEEFDDPPWIEIVLAAFDARVPGGWSELWQKLTPIAQMRTIEWLTTLALGEKLEARNDVG